jgi:hypothetical protein
MHSDVDGTPLACEPLSPGLSLWLSLRLPVASGYSEPESRLLGARVDGHAKMRNPPVT